MAWLERHMPTILVGVALFGLWQVSSIGVAEGLAYGPGRWWPWFLILKAVSSCLLLFALWVLCGLAARRFLDRRRAARLAHIFYDGDGQ